MTANEKTQPTPNSLRTLFPGLCPPGHENYRRAFTDGLVVLDANALLDIYRFNEEGRKEFLATLRLLGDRLWIPHRAAQEFLERRYSVISDSVAANDKFAGDLRQQLQKAENLIRETGKRRGLAADQVSKLVELIDSAADQVIAKLNEFYSFPFSPDESLREDAILGDVEELLSGKIGHPLEDSTTAEKEAHRRITERIPPGYADAQKGDRAIGDYLVWLQTLHKARDVGKPILMISGDQKEDWVRQDRGKKLGPHPKLVEEMHNVAGQEFYLVTVHSFLVNAKKYLAAEVSETTVEQVVESSPRKKFSWEKLLPALEIFATALQAQQQIASGEGFTDAAAHARRSFIGSEPVLHYSAPQVREAYTLLNTPAMRRYLASRAFQEDLQTSHGANLSLGDQATLADDADQSDGLEAERTDLGNEDHGKG